MKKGTPSRGVESDRDRLRRRGEEATKWIGGEERKGSEDRRVSVRTGRKEGREDELEKR